MICYDIVSDRRRNRIMRILKGFGMAVQKSVFECWLTENQLKVLIQRLKKEIKESEDSIRFYTLCSDCKSMIQLLGIGRVFEEEIVKVV